MALHKTCDGMRRRDFLKVGVAGGAGLTLANYLRLAEAGEIQENKAKAGIFIELPGGPSHMDTFDLKPDAPAEYRGTFNPIETNVSGIQISEHLPKIAKCMDKFVIMRGVTHTLGAHQLGREYVSTGNRPIPALEYPGYAAVVAKEFEAPKDIPPAVTVPRSNQRAGYLGVKYAPLNTNSSPQAGRPFNVRGIALGNGLTIAEVEKRNNLLRDLDATFAGLEKDNQLIDGLDRFGQQAYAMITSTRARQAFDISKESPAFSEPFGEDAFGQSCLLATRLIESGVKFVTLSLGGWDTHRDNFTSLRDRRLPPLDTGFSALLSGLEQKGLLDSTAVYVTGEFGRTPKINTRTEEGGRDHYPRCMFMLLAGGGIKGGQVIGRSDEKATLPASEDEGFSPDDVAASYYHALGINHKKEYHSTTGRPIMVVRNGRVVPQLFA